MTMIRSFTVLSLQQEASLLLLNAKLHAIKRDFVVLALYILVQL